MAARGVHVRIDTLPALQDVFPFLGSRDADSGVDTEHYPPSSQPFNLGDHCMYMHSSGSTGLPKTIHFTCIRFLQCMQTSETVTSLNILQSDILFRRVRK